ncbi:nucleoside-diphosphate kinase [Streptomyces johnsoniae]|uniref:Polymerase nucleotidyl transferase domain-containing protein n=1 Tax=Streptomyces johnsoniae TaxID=3075532 RepID=A0ABU2SD91_9ACTN|nr:hypothetical protein [Streptomyces sp. DSM 41886]MDT0446389.1 hypothetical protein [Streptomyces sp. DSM 41886]
MSVISISGAHHRERLLAWIADVTGGAEAEEAADGAAGAPGRTEIRTASPGPRIELVIPDRPGCDPTWWAAAAVRRRLRRVPDADACASPDLGSVLRDGSWQHPRYSHEAGVPAEFSGVLVFKPGIEVLPSTLRELAARLAECGYLASRARLTDGSGSGNRGKAAAHYLTPAALAERGTLMAQERLAFLEIYDRPEFVRRFGARPQDIEVVTARQIVEERGLSEELLEKWSTGSAELRGLDSREIDGPNEIGDCLFVNVHQEPGFHNGRALVVINPHMPGVLSRLEHSDNRTLAVLVTAHSPAALPWPRMRAEFCGATDPALALPGSLRGDALAGLFPLGAADGEPVRRTNNGVHLSNGAVEALHDAHTWFGLPPGRTGIGRAFTERGLDPETVLARPFVDRGGHRRAVATLTDGLDRDRAAELLAQGRLCGVDAFRSSGPSVRRVDLSWDVARRLRRERGVRAVLATGSTARNRACPDSDLNLLIVREAGASAVSRSTVDGIRVTSTNVPLADIEDAFTAAEEAAGTGTAGVAAGGGPADMGFETVLERLSAVDRLVGLPVWDPEGLAARWAERAAALRPPADAIARHLAGVRRAVTAAGRRTAPTGPASPDSVARTWHALRGAAHDLAVAVLALRSPRHHKPKWLPADLTAGGHPELLATLLALWQVPHQADEAEVRSALDLAGKLPGVDSRSLADAGSLFAADRRADALFCVRYAARDARLGRRSAAEAALLGRPPHHAPGQLHTRLADLVTRYQDAPTPR